MCGGVCRSTTNPMKKKKKKGGRNPLFIGRIYTRGGINNKFVIYFFSNIYIYFVDKYQFFG